MVPHVAESPRRVDKTAVLRFAAHGLRLKYGNFFFLKFNFIPIQQDLNLTTFIYFLIFQSLAKVSTVNRHRPRML